MSVISTDMVLRYSVVAAAGDTTASSAAASLGDQVATNGPATSGFNTFFDDVSAAEALAGDVEYRCVFVLNNHATDTAFAVKVEVTAEVALGASWALALDAAAVSAKGAATAQAATIANESTAPSGASAFGAGPLTIGDLAPGQVKGVWVRRTVTASTAALASDGATLRITGEG